MSQPLEAAGNAGVDEPVTNANDYPAKNPWVHLNVGLHSLSGRGLQPPGDLFSFVIAHRSGYGD